MNDVRQMIPKGNEVMILRLQGGEEVEVNPIDGFVVMLSHLGIGEGENEGQMTEFLRSVVNQLVEYVEDVQGVEDEPWGERSVQIRTADFIRYLATVNDIGEILRPGYVPPMQSS